MADSIRTHIVDETRADDIADLVAEVYDLLDGATTTPLLPIAAPRRPAEQVANRALISHARVGEPIDERAALVTATSGSTGTAKPVVVTRHNLVAAARAAHDALGAPGSWVLALPAHHIAGLKLIAAAHAAGTTPTIVPVGAGFHVNDFCDATLRALQSTSLPLYTSLVSVQVAKLRDSVIGLTVLSRYDGILLGGGPPPAGMVEDLVSRGINVHVTYGCAETTGGCVYDGRPGTATSISVDDNNRITVAGSQVALGYRWCRDLNKGVEFSGSFTTSDEGIIDPATGVLSVVGRADNVIVTGGLKLHPEPLERRITALAAVEQACIVAVPDKRLGQAAWCVYSGSAHPADIIRCLEDVPRWQLPRNIIRLKNIPMIGPGKPDRLAAAAAAASHATR